MLFHSVDLLKIFQKKLPDFIKNYKGKCFSELGVSVYGNDQIDLLNENILIDRIQLPFNLLDNSTLRKKRILKLKKEGKKVDGRSIFLQGLFQIIK